MTTHPATLAAAFGPVDLIVLLLIAGIIAGFVFGLRAIVRRTSAPSVPRDKQRQRFELYVTLATAFICAAFSRYYSAGPGTGGALILIFAQSIGEMAVLLGVAYLLALVVPRPNRFHGRLIIIVIITILMVIGANQTASH